MRDAEFCSRSWMPEIRMDRRRRRAKADVGSSCHRTCLLDPGQFPDNVCRAAANPDRNHPLLLPLHLNMIRTPWVNISLDHRKMAAMTMLMMSLLQGIWSPLAVSMDTREALPIFPLVHLKVIHHSFQVPGPDAQTQCAQPATWTATRTWVQTILPTTSQHPTERSTRTDERQAAYGLVIVSAERRSVCRVVDCKYIFWHFLMGKLRYWCYLWRETYLPLAGAVNCPLNDAFSCRFLRYYLSERCMLLRSLQALCVMRSLCKGYFTEFSLQWKPLFKFYSNWKSSSSSVKHSIATVRAHTIYFCVLYGFNSNYCSSVLREWFSLVSVSSEDHDSYFLGE